MKTEEKLRHIKHILDEMKAEDVVTIDAADRTILADAFVVVTATSDTHARSIGDRLHLRLKELGVRVDHAEMDPGREWTIMDFGDVVVHIFLEKARRYYNIEELWGLVQEVRKHGEEAAAGEEAEARPAKPRREMPLGMARLAQEAKEAKRRPKPAYRSGAKPKAPARKPGPS